MVENHNCMAMTFYLDCDRGGPDRWEQPETSTDNHGSPTMETKFHLLEDKILTPNIKDAIERPRLTTLLERSAQTRPATLITGRTGSGKTALAAGFVRCRNAAWLRLEPSENDWCIFAKYLEAAILRSCGRDPNSTAFEWSDPKLDYEKIIGLLGTIPLSCGTVPSVAVIDDLHHIFDAEWFIDIFTLMILAVPETTHLILLSRSRPPNPLWRMRSKQMLTVIDEAQLAFTPAEAVDLYSRYGLPSRAAFDTQNREFGRASRMMDSISPREVSAVR